MMLRILITVCLSLSPATEKVTTVVDFRGIAARDAFEKLAGAMGEQVVVARQVTAEQLAAEIRFHSEHLSPEQTVRWVARLAGLEAVHTKNGYYVADAARLKALDTALQGTESVVLSRPPASAPAEEEPPAATLRAELRELMARRGAIFWQDSPPSRVSRDVARLFGIDVIFHPDVLSQDILLAWERPDVSLEQICEHLAGATHAVVAYRDGAIFVHPGTRAAIQPAAAKPPAAPRPAAAPEPAAPSEEAETSAPDEPAVSDEVPEHDEATLGNEDAATDEAAMGDEEPATDEATMSDEASDEAPETEESPASEEPAEEPAPAPVAPRPRAVIPATRPAPAAPAKAPRATASAPAVDRAKAASLPPRTTQPAAASRVIYGATRPPHAQPAPAARTRTPSDRPVPHGRLKLDTAVRDWTAFAQRVQLASGWACQITDHGRRYEPLEVDGSVGEVLEALHLMGRIDYRIETPAGGATPSVQVDVLPTR